MIYITSTNRSYIVSAEAKISSNCGFPSNGTICWDVPTKAVNDNLWFIQKPTGYNNFTSEQMMSGVNLTGILEKEYNPDWFANQDVI